MNKVYVISTAHDAYRQREFSEGDIVIDPWRMIPPKTGVDVRRLGENKPAFISVLVPSRGRPDMFKRMYDSLVATVAHPRFVEVVAWLDDDDETDTQYPWQNIVPLTYIRGSRRLLSENWNRCADEARGEIFMHCGDDITFNTPGWDQRVRDTFEQIPDRIGLVFGDDLSPNSGILATHGFLHRRWVETVGYFLPPLFSSDWNDVWLSEVAQEINRFIFLPDVVTEHHHYSFGKAEHDQTHKEREARGAADGVVALFKKTKKQRANDAAKLKAVMA